MKKVVSFLPAVIFAMLISSCSIRTGEDVPDGWDVPAAGGVQLTITASGEAPGVRTVLHGGSGKDRNNVDFTASDALAVFDLEGNKSRFSIPEGKIYPDGSADFTGVVEGEYDRYYCLYPYSESSDINLKTLTGTLVYSEIQTEVPSVQQAVSGSFDPAAALSVGMAHKTGDDWSLALSNLCAHLKFSVPEGLAFSKAVLRAGGDEPICGPVHARIMHETGSLVNIVADGEGSEITLAGPLTGGEWYYFSAIPQTLASGFGIYLYDGDGNLASSCATSKSVDLKRSVILDLGEIQATASLEWTGSGTSADPYLIYTYDQLALLEQRLSAPSSASSYQGKCYRQMADITCGGRSIGIGGFSGGNPIFFTGTYDGNGHSITDYVPKAAVSGEYRYSGLFTQLKDATVKDLSLRPKAIMPFTPGNNSNIVYTAGALAGRVVSSEGGGTTITGCTVLGGETYEINLSADKSSVVSRIGGLLGSCEDCHLTVTLCTNHASISVKGGLNINDMHYPEGLGGILGYAESDDFEQIIRIDRCRNTGTLGDYNRTAAIGVGGIIGSDYEDIGTDETVIRISSCVNEGSLTAKNPNDSFDNNGIYSFSETYYSFTGGVIGFHDADGGDHDPYVYNCLNKGSLFAADQFGGAGGIIGYCYDDDTTIALCVNVGTFSGEEHTEFGAISASGDVKKVSGNNAYCVGCYWLDPVDSPGTPSLPLVHDSSSTDPFDCYHYTSLSYEHPANRITKGWNTSNTEWTQSQWNECAGLWTGGAEWGQSLSEITLDLDF